MTEFSRIADDVELGDGVDLHAFIALAGCAIGSGSRIGTFVEIQRGAVIGRNVTISSHVFVGGKVDIGDDAFVGHNVSFPSGADEARTRVGRGASIGPGTVVQPGVAIGAHAVVAAGSVVRLDVPERVVPDDGHSVDLPDDAHSLDLRDVARSVEATFAKATPLEDPAWELALAEALRASHGQDALRDLAARFRDGECDFDRWMRRVVLRARCAALGSGLHVEPGALLKHPETMTFGDGVFVGAQAILAGRFDGACSVGSHVWIGPQAFLDARAVTIEDWVGWGPGARLLGSTHNGVPLETPIIATDLAIRPVHVGFGADIGMNASILPGVRVGAHAVVGVGAVVVHDVPEYAVVAGVPARVLRDRREGVS